MTKCLPDKTSAGLADVVAEERVNDGLVENIKAEVWSSSVALILESKSDQSEE